MRAAFCRAYGGPIEIADVPTPEPGPGQVRVTVEAAGVNFTDVLLVNNKYQVSASLPFTPGSEFAGVVSAAGEGVDRLSPGDRVSGATLVGAFAQEIVVDATSATLVPEGVASRDAAAFGVAHATAYHALRSFARVQPGEWVVVLGAAGGVGLAAVALARVLGARVVAAASSADKLEACREQGADALVNYGAEDLKDRIKTLTGGGAHVVLDPVGGSFSEAALRATRWGGRFVCLGFASGDIPRIPLNLILLKGVILTAFEFRGFGLHAPDELRRNNDELRELLREGRIRPYVSAVFPLSETAQALNLLAERRSIGKILIDPNG